jgi:flavin-dependent dehydrogenase
MKNDPYVSKCLGPNPNIERMKSASLRLGGEKNTYGEHLLVIGDAAGFIDPLTGGKFFQFSCQIMLSSEGIQYALESGMIAADTLREAFKKGDVR